MPKFSNPTINPFQLPQNIGTNSISSKYLFNFYDQEFTNNKWREAIDQALRYSNLVQLDALYSWCIQTSPFLASQIDKRVRPIAKREYAFMIDGKINKAFNRQYIHQEWFRQMVKERILATFYGVRCFSIEPTNGTITSFPLRNLDIFNEAIREMTYDYYEVVDSDTFDNLFFIQPTTDQDFRLGLMQQISRSMIAINEMYCYWSISGIRYSNPMTVVGFLDNNETAKSTATDIANNLNPMSTPVIPYTQRYDGNQVYQIDIKPINTQSYPDAFRLYKEAINSHWSEIMQLVTGGTLIGATEKNTNSEQLAEIHFNLYSEILDDDSSNVIDMFNSEKVRKKLAKTFKDDRFLRAELIEIAPDVISIDKFTKVGDVLAKHGLRYNPEILRKIGMSVDDVDTSFMTTQWASIKKGLASMFTHNKGEVKEDE